VESEVSSADSARQLSKGFNVLLAVGAGSREGKNEEVLLRKTTATSDGNKIIFNLTMPRQDIIDVINKGLASATPTGSPS
jgi:hypothetical protein